jgi:hypothetical protein
MPNQTGFDLRKRAEECRRISELAGASSEWKLLAEKWDRLAQIKGEQPIIMVEKIESKDVNAYRT